MSLLDKMEREAELRGKAIGREEAAKSIASYLIKDGRLPLEDIARACLLSIRCVEELAFSIDESRFNETLALSFIVDQKLPLEDIAETCNLTLQRVHELAKTAFNS